MDLINVPPQKKHIFWSADTSKLDRKKHQKYIVHQVLQHGTLDDFKWLQKIYSPSTIKQTFLKKPRRTYSLRTFNFVKNHLLKINNHLDFQKYVSV